MKKLMLFLMLLISTSPLSAEEKRTFQFGLDARFLANNSCAMDDPNITSMNMNLNDVGVKFSVQYFISRNFAARTFFDLGEVRQETLLYGGMFVDRISINNRKGLEGKFYIDDWFYIGAGALQADIKTLYYTTLALPRVESGLGGIINFGAEQPINENFVLSLSYQATLIFLDDQNGDFMRTQGKLFFGEFYAGVLYRL